MEEVKNNSQLYTTQEDIGEIKNQPSGIHYPGGYRRY